MRIALPLALIGALFLSSATHAADKPRVLLIGDSISIYYRPYVAEFLKDKAVVAHSGHAADSAFGLARIDAILAKNKANVIHFNWGLHDLKPDHGQPNNVPLDEYEKNLREIVKRMKATGAKLIFATTTPVGPRTDRKNDDVIRYNAAAVKIMKEEGVAIDDLYAAAAPIREKIQYQDNVHFKPYAQEAPPADDAENGCKILGKAVAESVLKALGDAPADAPKPDDAKQAEPKKEKDAERPAEEE